MEFKIVKFKQWLDTLVTTGAKHFESGEKISSPAAIIAATNSGVERQISSCLQLPSLGYARRQPWTDISITKVFSVNSKQRAHPRGLVFGGSVFGGGGRGLFFALFALGPRDFLCRADADLALADARSECSSNSSSFGGFNRFSSFCII